MRVIIDDDDDDDDEGGREEDLDVRLGGSPPRCCGMPVVDAVAWSARGCPGWYDASSSLLDGVPRLLALLPPPTAEMAEEEDSSLGALVVGPLFLNDADDEVAVVVEFFAADGASLLGTPPVDATVAGAGAPSPPSPSRCRRCFRRRC